MGNRKWLLIGIGFLLGDDDNVLKLIAMIAAQLSEYTKSHLIVHFKWANYMVCEL